MTNRLGVVVCLHTELTQLFGRHIVQDALPLSRHFLNVCLRPERLETFVNFQCETVSDSESARALSESARVRPQRGLDTPDHPPPAPDKNAFEDAAGYDASRLFGTLRPDRVQRMRTFIHVGRIIAHTQNTSLAN